MISVYYLQTFYKLSLSIVFLLLVSIGANAMSFFSKPKTVFNQQPYFTLYMKTQGCDYKIWLNDIPASPLPPEGLPVNFAIPVNEWMLSEQNTLAVQITPNTNIKDNKQVNQICSALVELNVEPMSAPKGQSKTVAQLQYSSNSFNLNDKPDALNGSSAAGNYRWQNGLVKLKNDDKQIPDIVLGDITITPTPGKYGQGVTINRTVTLPKLPFPKWSWLKGDTILDDEATHKILNQQYQLIWNAIQAKDTDTLNKFFNARAKELAVSYYSDFQEMNVVTDMIKNRSNSKLELTPYMPQYAYYHFYGPNHQLAELTRWDGSDAISFDYKDGSSSISYGIVFAKIKGNWVVVR